MVPSSMNDLGARFKVKPGDNTFPHEKLCRVRFWPWWRFALSECSLVNPLVGTLKPQNNGPLYSNMAIRTLAVDGCYIWYSEKGPGRAASPPSSLLAVPNVTAHPSTTGVPTSYYSMWHYNYLCPLKGWDYYLGCCCFYRCLKIINSICVGYALLHRADARTVTTPDGACALVSRDWLRHQRAPGLDQAALWVVSTREMLPTTRTMFYTRSTSCFIHAWIPYAYRWARFHEILQISPRISGGATPWRARSNALAKKTSTLAGALACALADWNFHKFH